MAMYKNLLVAACLGTQLTGCMTQLPDRGESDPLRHPYSKLSQESVSPATENSDDVRPEVVKAPGKQKSLKVAAENDTDFWSDFHNQMSIAPQLNASLLADEIAWLERHPNYLRNNLSRGSQLLPFLLEEAERHGLPAEVALIPAVESTYNPKAVSGAGPTGLWQFTASTARSLGIKTNAHFDGRKDVVESTEAAYRYLSQLGKQFDNNWLLAFAAYNCGPALVERAARGPYKSIDVDQFERLRIPSHTKRYVTKIMAMAYVVHKNTAKRGVLPAVSWKDGFDIVDFYHAAPLTQIANQAGVSMNDLAPFNTGLTRNATHPTAPQRLLIDKQVAWKLSAVDWNIKRSPQPVYAEGYVYGTDHVVKAGDTLVALANRYGTSPEYLRKVNRLMGDQIRVGQTLRVPDLKATRLTADKNTPL